MVSREKIQTYLIDNGVKPQLLGFKYLTDAIELVNKDINYQYCITKMLYPEIAVLNKTTVIRVERAIRYSLENAKLRFTNSHFIALSVLEVNKK